MCIFIDLKDVRCRKNTLSNGNAYLAKTKFEGMISNLRQGMAQQ